MTNASRPTRPMTPAERHRLQAIQRKIESMRSKNDEKWAKFLFYSFTNSQNICNFFHYFSANPMARTAWSCLASAPDAPTNRSGSGSRRSRAVTRSAAGARPRLLLSVFPARWKRATSAFTRTDRNAGFVWPSSRSGEAFSPVAVIPYAKLAWASYGIMLLYTGSGLPAISVGGARDRYSWGSIR